MSTRTVLINTDASGAFIYERPLFGAVIGILTEVGDLDTPTIVISDPVSGYTLRTLTGISANDYYQPSSPLVVFGTLRVAVTSGGDSKHGSVRLLVET